MMKKLILALCTVAAILFAGKNVCAASDVRLAALTFDDGPSDHAELFMNTLDKYGAKGTFFVRGKNASGHAGVDVHTASLSRMVSEGHEIANHTYSHELGFEYFSQAQVNNELDRVNKYIFSAYGHKVRVLVRPPEGISPASLAAKIHAPIIRWSLSTEDYLSHSGDDIYNRVVDNIRDGDIILMHENVPQSAAAMDRFIPELEKKGFRFVTVTELFRRKGINLKNGQVYENAYTKNKAADDKNIYRLYNSKTGEHFYTASIGEKNSIVRAGWRDEGIGWKAPAKGTSVYRLYNKRGGEHHYTMSMAEKKKLLEAGWQDEGIGWYSEKSDATDAVPVYRQYNPNAFSNNHNYSTSGTEKDRLVKTGWKDEGIGWYGVR